MNFKNVTLEQHAKDARSTLNVVAISQASKLLLTSCVPHIILDRSSVGVENQWVHLYSKSS